jgi:outer membrane protein
VRNFLFTAAAVLVAASAPVMAQQTQPLTLQDCIRLAESVPSSVSLARQDRDIAARDVTQARAGFLPQSHFATGFIYNSPLSSNRELVSMLPLNGIREYSAIVALNQEFDTSGRLRAELARARVSVQNAGTSLAVAQRDLRRAVTLAHYRALLTRRIVRITREALAESQSFEKRAKLLFDGGEAARADVVKASAQSAALQQALAAAELEAELANQELAAFWTRDVSATLELADALDSAPPPPEGEQQQAAPFLKRLEFNLLDSQRAGFQADVRHARSALLPQLGVAFQYGLDSTAVRIRDRGYAAFINLTIPIFDWNKARAAMQQARLKTEQVDSTRAISERNFSKEYQGALARVKRLFEQIALTERQAKLAEEDLRLSRVRYEGGEGLALDVVSAQNQYAQARTNYYVTMVNYLSARADLEVASGR